MLSRELSPLMFLLVLTGMSNAQFDGCNYEQTLNPGQTYYIYNPNYPNDESAPMNSCRWIVNSDRLIKMNCSISLPESPYCKSDAFILQTSATNQGERYCGTGPIDVHAEDGNRIIVSSHLSAGRFLCEVRSDSDNNNECSCGWKNPTRIVGGVSTGVNEYPMMAGLIDVINQNVFCGSTIINTQQVLTAANCVNGRSSNTVGVMIGDHDISKTTDTNATKLYKVASIIIHPEFSTDFLDYDIAVITIDGTMIYSHQVGPACLPFQHSLDSFGGNYVDLLGWGLTEFGGRQSPVLQDARVSVITNKICMETYSEIGSRQLCTLTDGKDSCEFDSGGPVLWENPTTKNIVLVAIIGYSRLCADEKPSVNSRVGAYIDWIRTQAPQGYQYCENE
ncbi:GSCOCT00014118001.2-RA-CDS [Cotesia congregata]|uniref:Venom serine protease 34-like n=1 Tax=Cotesia congregata TaxID=51543 RepID=A0A8J2MRF0_COTCN|nr:GSCOCT00014118001.2-RA-CDS [Cotesia congregata]CAG5103413.1 Venom serine protease 34-like [Cotesia congregata]